MFRRNKAVFLAALTFSIVLLVKPATGSPAPPVASFTYTPEKPIFGDVVIFNASASYDPDGGDILSYRWDFDDGTVETLPNPVRHHNYTAVGTYNVTLTVTDDQTETGTTWQIVTVREYPVASFTYSPESPVEGETVTFNASLSTADGGTIMNYTWDFDDENITTVTDAVITHVYTAEGNYNVTLTVADDEGLTDTCSQLITVRGYPVASFIYSPDRPIVNETVTFNASSSTADGGTIVSYFWDFGDENNATDMIVEHTYTATGDYTVTLTVTDSEELTDTAQATFTVRGYPVATFTYSPALPLVGEIVTFNASLSTPDGANIVSYDWDFGDQNSGTGMIVNHTYTTFGNHTASLMVTDSEDLSDTCSKPIRILIAPVADFTYSPTEIAKNETVTFDASASYDPDRIIASYDWDFGDQNSGTGMIVNHTYTTEGTYNVTLTVTDDDGLTDSIWELVTVLSYVPIHDIAITSVTTSAAEVYVGLVVNITVTAKNEGTEVESFSVTVYYNAMSVETKTVPTLLPNSEITLTFSWNALGVSPGYYTISANATITTPGVDADDDMFDNFRQDGVLRVRLWGDVNGDDRVSLADVGKVKLIISGMIKPPYYPPYMPDVNNDGRISLADIGKVKLIISGIL